MIRSPELRAAMQVIAADRKARKAERPARTPKVMDGEPGAGTPRTTISRKRRDEILERQGRICPACNEPLESSEMPSGVDGVPGWTLTGPFEIDHVIPIELGGSASELSNLQALHPDCHKAKTKRDVAAIAKTKRLAKKHFEGRKPSRMRSRGFG